MSPVGREDPQASGTNLAAPINHAGRDISQDLRELDIPLPGCTIRLVED